MLLRELEQPDPEPDAASPAAAARDPFAHFPDHLKTLL